MSGIFRQERPALAFQNIGQPSHTPSQHIIVSTLVGTHKTYLIEIVGSFYPSMIPKMQ